MPEITSSLPSVAHATRHSDYIIYVDERVRNSPQKGSFLAFVERAARSATKVLEAKFYRDKVGNKYGVGLKVFP